MYRRVILIDQIELPTFKDCDSYIAVIINQDRKYHLKQVV